MCLKIKMREREKAGFQLKGNWFLEAPKQATEIKFSSASLPSSSPRSISLQPSQVGEPQQNLTGSRQAE